MAKLDSLLNQCQRELDDMNRLFEENKLSKLDYVTRLLNIHSSMKKASYLMMGMQEQLGCLDEIEKIDNIIESIEQGDAEAMKFIGE